MYWVKNGSVIGEAKQISVGFKGVPNYINTAFIESENIIFVKGMYIVSIY